MDALATADPVLLARIQFAVTIAFHIIFPAFTIGLSAWIATLEAMWLRSGNDRYAQLARFWTKIFAVSFAMGVVSGIVLSYQFGTNWSRFSVVVGNIVAPLMGYEVLTAFFLEATFLGVMLFGWNRVSPRVHFTASLLVALGTLLSAFWILSANSWMQSPAGHVIRDGIAYPENWWRVVFNPTFPLRFLHMVMAAYMTTAIVVLAAGARYLLQGRHEAQAGTMVRMGLGMLIAMAPLQLVIGDLHGLKAAEVQPAKVAAIEAHWDGSKPAPFVFFAWPDEAAEANRFEIAVPNVGSLLITHQWEGTFPGLKDFPPEDRPPVWPVFFAFRIMVGIGFFLIGMAAAGGWLWYRGRLHESRRYLRVAAWSWPLGFIAILAGWVTAEVGRQPWVATGILRTVDAASPVPAGSIITSLALFVLVYGVVFSIGIYYINRLLVRGPAEPAPEEGAVVRPISAAHAEGRRAVAGED